VGKQANQLAGPLRGSSYKGDAQKTIWAPGGGAGIVIIDFTGSDWCGPCQNLEAEVFDNPTFRTWFNLRPLTPLRIDYTMYTPQPPDLQVQMAQLWNKYDIKAFPTLLATDSAGVEIDRIVGYASGYGPNKYIEDLKATCGIV
jgi:thiol-disulfide isomerase/thioredoxin